MKFPPGKTISSPSLRFHARGAERSRDVAGAILDYGRARHKRGVSNDTAGSGHAYLKTRSAQTKVSSPSTGPPDAVE